MPVDGLISFRIKYKSFTIHYSIHQPGSGWARKAVNTKNFYQKLLGWLNLNSSFSKNYVNSEIQWSQHINTAQFFILRVFLEQFQHKSTFQKIGKMIVFFNFKHCTLGKFKFVYKKLSQTKQSKHIFPHKMW